jgi:octaprenyl-diphosphate synthase
MAFQIADDLLDYTESEAVVGKPTGQDLREHKVTLPLIAALRRWPAAERARGRGVLRRPGPDEDGIESVIPLVREHGGLEYARNRADEFGDGAAEALLELPDGARPRRCARPWPTSSSGTLGRRRGCGDGTCQLNAVA